MSLTVSPALLAETKAQAFAYYRTDFRHHRLDREIALDEEHLTMPDLDDLAQAANVVQDKKTARALQAIMNARIGDFTGVVPNFKAFKATLLRFLRANLIDGWIYVCGDDGEHYPELVVGIDFNAGDTGGREQPPRVTIRTMAYSLVNEGRRGRLAAREGRHVFHPQDVARRTVSAALLASGIFKETKELKSAYLESMKRHRDLVANGFTKQFRFDGTVHRFDDGENYWRRAEQLRGRKVINDMGPEEYGPLPSHMDSVLFDTDDKENGVGGVPEHPLAKLFDLKSHEFYWVNTRFMTPYAYDKTLRDKLILPDSHRDLLDVLTSDLSAFTGDIIEGKSAGNVIMCKGVPGVGKTLTAEVYSELIESPLYMVHSGNLGTTPAEIHEGLELLFARARRWNCVLLLDEADVFVAKRRDSIEQNAIVAEFLRTLEYFDGLLFLTTNRVNDIDEAILHRCAAVIGYPIPEKDDARKVWGVMAAEHKLQLPPQLVEDLLVLFPSLAPRDIKMLLRLALRISKSRSEELSVDVFRQCAMFRDVEIAQG